METIFTFLMLAGDEICDKLGRLLSDNKSGLSCGAETSRKTTLFSKNNCPLILAMFGKFSISSIQFHSMVATDIRLRGEA